MRWPRMPKISIKAKMNIRKVIGYWITVGLGAYGMVLFGTLVESNWSSELCGFIFIMYAAICTGLGFLISEHWGTLTSEDIAKGRKLLKDSMDSAQEQADEIQESNNAVVGQVEEAREAKKKGMTVEELRASKEVPKEETSTIEATPEPEVEVPVPEPTPEPEPVVEEPTPETPTE